MNSNRSKNSNKTQRRCTNEYVNKPQ